MGNARRADDTHTLALGFGESEQRRGQGGAVAAARWPQAAALRRVVDLPDPCAVAREHRRRRARRVGHLRIEVVGFHQCGFREILPSERERLAVHAQRLPREDASRRHRGHAHAVPDEDNRVFRCPLCRQGVACGS